ncbi:MAG: histidine--tRNA ligase [Metallosphaera yellowstonensis]|jgi:histidyl-tRNA synthetase|uniref:Histidine--tRNA ligase n=1 Tax=Metallosphaera yellowstonensis MK1 TaxID=671065 RepID=H2C6Q6_9CREN|nr:histidine--tRNA ligase [Metallosphaera yellowstonensis]EHP69483.1 histidyl-tRNA synthetase [Metallosphaera yellowstonensis MK1]
MISYEPVRGMEDYFGEKAQQIRFVENTFRAEVEKAGYMEAITPVVEEFNLFSIKGGEELRQTMYVFKDKADRELALRPEITPSIVRLFMNSLQHYPRPVRLYYVGRVYRYDEPQLGRYREFRQAGVEMIGSDSILSDFEQFEILSRFYSRLGMKDKIVIKINNIGIYRRIFEQSSIDDNSQEHILHLMDKGKIDETIKILENSLKSNDLIEFIRSLLSNKSENLNEIINNAEKIGIRGLTDEIQRLVRLQNLVGSLGLRTKVDLSFVRGLAYYTGSIFEVTVPGLPFSIAGGGRYDTLVEIYGGPKVPSVGFAIGVERTLLAIGEMKPSKPKVIVGAVLLEEAAMDYGLRIVSILREAGITTVLNVKEIPLSKLVPLHAEQGFTHLIIIGRREKESGKVTVRELQCKKQLELNVKELVSRLESWNGCQ